MLNGTSMAPSVLSETEEHKAWSAANLDEETKIDAALSQYNRIRAQYGETLSEAIHTQDPARRTQLVSTITAMNQQLTTIVASLQEMYSSGKTTLSGLPKINFAADLEQYKLDLERLLTERDELSKLRTVYTTLKQDAVAPPYTLYVIGILAMLVILLVLFTFTSLMTNVQSVLPAMPAMPELPSLGLSAPTPAPAM
jgi:hypothetical protein